MDELLKKAFNRLSKLDKDEQHLNSAIDVGESIIFNTGDPEGYSAMYLIVNKETLKVEEFDFMKDENIILMENGVSIPVPEQYR